MCDQSKKFVNNLPGLDSFDVMRWRPLWPFQMLRLFINQNKLNIKRLLTLGIIWRRIKYQINTRSLWTIPTTLLSWSWDTETIVILNPVVAVKRNWAYVHKWIIVRNRKNNKMCDQSKKFVNNLSWLDTIDIMRWRPLWPIQMLKIFHQWRQVEHKMLAYLGNQSSEEE